LRPLWGNGFVRLERVWITGGALFADAISVAPVLGSLSDGLEEHGYLSSLLGSDWDYVLLAFAPTLPWFFPRAAS